MSKPHGHYCRICRQYRANEKFSGRGHAAHICKDCAKCGNTPPELDNDGTIINPLPKQKRHRKLGKTQLILASQKEQSKGFLKHLLANGDASEFAIHEKAGKVGLPKEALLGAKNALGIIVVETENGFVWRLPKA
jgi:hypothetical protein